MLDINDRNPLASDVDTDGDGTPDELDCQPLNFTVAPGLTESCDAIDSDCDGSLVDEFTNSDDDELPDCIDLDDDGAMVLDDGAGGHRRVTTGDGELLGQDS